MSTNTVRKELADDFQNEFDRLFGDQFKTSSTQPAVAAAPQVMPAPAPVAAAPVVVATPYVPVSHDAPVAAPVVPAPVNVAPPAPKAPIAAPAAFNDPLLAELARIVGNGSANRPSVAQQPVAMPAKHDPLAAFEEELRRFDELHRAAPAAPVAEPVHTPVIAAPEVIPVVAPIVASELELRGAASEPALVPSVEPAPASQVAYEEPVADYPAVAAAEQGADQGRQRRVVIMLGAAAAIAVVGLVGAVAMKSKGSMRSGSEPPIIAAKTQPMKEKPTDPGGIEISGQDRQVLSKGSSDPKGPATVLNKEEQPVDLNQTPKRDVARVVLPASNGSAPAAAPIIMPPPSPAPTAAAPAPAKVESPVTAGGFEAKRVRSIKVGPEGDAMQAPLPSQPDIPPVGATAAAPSPSATIAAAPPPRVQTPATPAAQSPAPKAATTTGATPAQTSAKSEARPVTAARPQSATPAARPAPRTAAPAEDADEPANGNAPVSLRPPSGASPTRAVPKTASAAPAPAAAAGSKGSFAVQLAASPSESDARSTAARLKQSSALSGYTPTWKTSEVNGRTVYRVRVGNLSREAANELCGKVKAGGGSCFVAGN